jgi:hypothetical protein
MRNAVSTAVIALSLLTAAFPQSAQDSNLAAISAIRREALQHSQVGDILSWISDVYGPRVTGAPSMIKASDWALSRLSSWHLANGHREYWQVGEGWSLRHFDMQMIEPQAMPVIGLPVAWTPGTNGEIRAEALHLQLENDADLAKWKGKLKGKIVLLQPERTVDFLTLPLTHRYTESELADLARTPIPRRWLNDEGKTPATEGGVGFQGPAQARSKAAWQDRLIRFLKDEGVVALVDRGSDDSIVSVGRPEQNPQMTQRTDGGTIFVDMSRPGLQNQQRLLPWITVAVEHYNRILRILKRGIPVVLTLRVDVAWHPEPAEGNGFNTIAEIPGTDLKDEVVLLGAHLDSKHAGTGATDDGAGCAAILEAVRILQQVGIRPRRTIRVALWGGEELGLLGSQAFVAKHYNRNGIGEDPKKLVVYFNADNGAGRIRGVWAQNNLAAESLLTKWLEPLHDLGVTTVARRGTVGTMYAGRIVGGTDHLAFDAIGIPAFQFIQDRLEYNSRTAHSNMDFVDHTQENDLIQMALVIATIAYEASISDQEMPRPGAASR